MGKISTSTSPHSCTRSGSRALRLSDACTLRASFPEERDGPGEPIAQHPFDIGKEIEVRLGEREGLTTATLFEGEIVTLEPQFGAGDVQLLVRTLTAPTSCFVHGRCGRFTTDLERHRHEDRPRGPASASGPIQAARFTASCSRTTTSIDISSGVSPSGSDSSSFFSTMRRSSASRDLDRTWGSNCRPACARFTPASPRCSRYRRTRCSPRNRRPSR